MSTSPLHLARDAWSMVIRQRQAKNEYAFLLLLSMDLWSIVFRPWQATNEYDPPLPASQGTRGQWSYDQGKQQMSTPPVRLSRDAWSMVIRLSKKQMSTPTLRLARDALSMVIQVRQATNEYAHPPSRKGRGVNGHTT